MKIKFWKYATTLLVAIIILNPEMVELALIINTIGLDMFLVTVEVQIAAMIGTLFNTRIRNFLDCPKHLWLRLFNRSLWGNITKKPAYLILITPSPATLMHLLVISMIISIAFGTGFEFNKTDCLACK